MMESVGRIHYGTVVAVFSVSWRRTYISCLWAASALLLLVVIATYLAYSRPHGVGLIMGVVLLIVPAHLTNSLLSSLRIDWSGIQYPAPLSTPPFLTPTP